MSEGMHEYSRPLASAEALGDNADSRHCFIDKSVLLTGEEDVLSTKNGQECFRISLRLLLKICQHVSVSLPASFSELREQCREIAIELTDTTKVVFLGYPAQEDAYDAILCVGQRYTQNLPRTVINSNGWLARVSSGSTNISGDCTCTNPIGAMGAACLGVTEVFKRLIKLKQERGNYFDGLAFSLLTYESNVSDPGPAIPDSLKANIAVFGAGAIGNGILYLLHSIQWQGHIDVVDRQQYGKENIGTCLMLGPSGVGVSKAEYIEGLLKPAMDIQGFVMDIESYTNNPGPDYIYTEIILNGLDNIDARYAAQELWPDMIIDGAISTFASQVSSHPWEKDIACLHCMFQKPVQSADLISSKMTGLPLSHVTDPMHKISLEDVALASEEKKEWLNQHIGKTVCSVISEAMAKNVSEQPDKISFEPSVPFVACMSAAMVVAEAVKKAANWPTLIEPQYQFDILHGPQIGQFISMTRKRECKCVTRKRNIDFLRNRRLISSK